MLPPVFTCPDAWRRCGCSPLRFSHSAPLIRGGGTAGAFRPLGRFHTFHRRLCSCDRFLRVLRSLAGGQADVLPVQKRLDLLPRQCLVP